MTTATFPLEPGKPQFSVRYNLSRDSAAEFSMCERYRYILRRNLAGGDVLGAPDSLIVWLMLNPSTADALVDDPTIRRCKDFARRWGYSDICVVNMFALRATDPAELTRADDPTGPDNDYVISNVPKGIPVVAGWGAHKTATPARVRRVIELLGRTLLCLGTNADGSPKHPLYLSKEAKLRPWAPKEAA